MSAGRDCRRGGVQKKSRWPAAHHGIEHKGEAYGVSVTAVCRKVGMTRANYYARRKARQGQQVDEQLVVELVCAERQLQPRLGGRKLYFLISRPLAQAGVKVGRDRFFEVLRQRDLLVKRQPGEYPCTTDSYHYLPVFTNLAKDVVVSRPNEVWVVDLTFLRTAEGFMYLSLLTDKWSRKILGYHCGDSLAAEGCQAALAMALAALPAGVHPIHHSDRGSQYCSHAYVEDLAARGISISMTEMDHCAENALAERMNGILKSEYGLGQEMPSKEQARRMAGQAVSLYNTRRPHTSLGYRFPETVHSLAV